MPSKKSAKPKLVKENPVERAEPPVPSERRSGRSAISSGPARPYVKIVEWSPEDACFVGSAPPLVGRCCHGDRVKRKSSPSSRRSWRSGSRSMRPTQRELARRLGVHESQISRDERNEYFGVTLERAMKVLEALHVRLRTKVEIEAPPCDAVLA